MSSELPSNTTNQLRGSQSAQQEVVQATTVATPSDHLGGHEAELRFRALLDSGAPSTVESTFNWIDASANGITSTLGQEIDTWGDERSTNHQAEHNQVGNARQRLFQGHPGVLRQLEEQMQQSEHHQPETGVVLHNGMRRAEGGLRSTGPTATRTDLRQTLAIDAGGESHGRLNQYLTTQQRNHAIGEMLRREESRHQYRVEANAQDIVNEIATSETPGNANLAVADTGTLSETARSVEHSQTARRDLERALRDYRIARRVLRTHYTNETNSSVDQSSPTYQGVLAQLAESQNNNRNRMRARGQSRSNTLERTDAIASRIAAAAGISSDTWRSDEDDEPMATRSASSIAQQDERSIRQSVSSGRTAAAERITPVASNTTPGPYLGPTSTAGDLSGTTGGMRNFYRRVEGQDRAAGRSGGRMSLSAVQSRFPRILPEPRSLGDSTRQPVVSAQRDPGSDRQQRVQDTLDRLNGSLSPAQKRVSVTISDVVKIRATNALKYLSKLKTANNDGERALVFAKDLGIDSIAESLIRESDYDLPLRINEMPYIQYSTWLTVGVSWKGIQKGGTGGSAMPGAFATGPLFEAGGREDRTFQLRAWRHRERIRRERELLMSQEADPSNPLPTATANEQRTILSRIGNSGSDSLADVERHLTNLLEEEERRISQNEGWTINSGSSRPRSATVLAVPPADKGEMKDQWPVQVVLHEVDWQTMTVAGTMIASQIVGRTGVARGQAAVNEGAGDGKDKEEQSPDMQTFFDGEIIDFRTHELETVANKGGYRIGGPLTDLKYWSQIGPFKAELAKRVQEKQEKHAKEMYERLGISGTLDEQRAEYQRTFGDNQDGIEMLDRDEIDHVAYGVMAECLGSRKWLEKACGDGGWILMRWKERCFVTPPSSRPSSSSGSSNNNEHSRIRTVVHRPTTTHQYTTIYSDDRHHDRSGAWGLTIQGFYYVALNRLSGRIEALYFDNGSQPYQELRCTPADSISDNINKEGEENIFDGLGDIGIRKNFGVYEFR